MGRMRAYWKRLCWAVRPGAGVDAADAELAQELEGHLAMAVEDGLRAGLTEGEARRQALIRLGGLERTAIAHREQRGLPRFEELVQDVGYGLRVLRKNPGFTLLTVLTLALGIGANTALFSIVDAVLLNPLPYPHPEQLVSVHASKPNFEHGSISYPNFRDWQRENRSLAALAVSRGWAATLTGSGEPERISVQFVSSDFLPILGVKPLLGRLFAGGEDEIGASPVVLLSRGMWQKKFGGRTDVLGKVLTLDGRNFTVIGVLPAGFDTTFSVRPPDVYAPFGQFPAPGLKLRGAGLGIHGMARLKPGVSFEQAQQDLDRVSDRLAEMYPKEDKGLRASLVPMRQTVVGRVQPLLLVLLGAVGFVLLIACANVANLLIAKASTRGQEFAVRLALGATRGRIVRQLLTESVLLAVVGGALGLLLAFWGTHAALGLVSETLPRASEVHMSVRVLAFTLAVSLAAGIVLGLLPAFRMTRRSVRDALQEGGRGTRSTRQQGQSALVIFEMALALMLLTGAGLMIRTLVALSRVNAGFDPHGVMTVSLAPSSALKNAEAPQIRAYLREVERRMAETPGVEAGSTSDGSLPMTGGDDEELFWKENEAQPASDAAMHWALRYMVGPQYLKVMGIPLQRGRFFQPGENEHSPTVAVVDETFAKQFFPGEDPIGKRLNLNHDGEQVEIVGLVGHVMQWEMDNDARFPLHAQIYENLLQAPESQLPDPSSGVDLIVRAANGVEATTLIKPLEHSLLELDRGQVVYAPLTMEHLIERTLRGRRFLMIVLVVFAGLALVLSSVGIYGVISYVVSQQTHDIGVRMALGADRKDVVRWVLTRGGRLALTGALGGVAASLVLARVMVSSSLLYGVKAWDPWTLGSVTVLLTGVALAACLAPAMRAMRVDPLTALRSE